MPGVRAVESVGEEVKHIISLGAGVQSSTMALMAGAGEIKPMPDAAIFSDTGWEPREVYEWLGWLEKLLPFPVYRVKHYGESLRKFTLSSSMRNTKRPIPIPLFAMKDGKLGIVQRHCTRDWKIRPIHRKVKELIGHKKGTRLPTEPVVTQWIGISLDEAQRMKPSRDKWTLHRYPFVFEIQMRRKDCLEWMKSHGYPEPPRSACIGCPFHDDYEWWRIKQDPEAWADAVEVDETLRNTGGEAGQVFLHSSGRPLTEAVPDKEPKRKEDNPVNLQLFNECEGMCGV